MSEPTCWTVLEDAAAGSASARDDFVRRYEPVAAAYFTRRWRGTRLVSDVDDACQEVLVACLEPGGLVERADRDRDTGFRAFLFGLVRNVAARFEEGRARGRGEEPSTRALEGVESDETRLSLAFDRAWARALVREATERLEERARDEGARRRYEILRLRFQEGRPLRDIAVELGRDPDRLHEDYARARREFEAVFLETVAFTLPSTPGDVRRECTELLGLL